MVHKTCTKCNLTLGDVHGNTKYCENCRRDIRLKQNRDKQQRHRDRTNKGTLISDNPHNQIGYVTSPEKNPIIPASFNSPDQFAVVFQDVLEHFSFSFNQQLLGMKAELLEQQKALAIQIDEMEFTLKQNPEYNKRLGERNMQLNKAIQLYKTFGKHVTLNKIRQHLELILKVSKSTAEDILKQAVQRIEFDKDNDQSDLSEFS